MRRFAVVVALAVIPSCDTGSETTEILRSMRDAWLRRDVTDYTMVYERDCFCDPAVLGQWRVTVQNGSVTSVRSVRTSEPPPALYANSFPTITEIFDQLIRHAEDGGTLIQVSYHLDYHFPTIAVGDHQGAADGGFRIEITEFTAAND